MSDKIKQINAALRFTNVLLACLIKVINISSEQKRACTFTNKTTQLSIKTGKITFPWMGDPEEIVFLKIRWYKQQIGSLHYPKKTQKYRGAIQPCIVYWGTTNLKDT